MSIKKKWLGWAFVACAIFIVLSLAVVFLGLRSQAPVAVRIGTGSYIAHLANTDEARTQGLSGRGSLGATEAMLLVFERDDKWAIWMKDMNYPIDAVWLDANKKIVHIEENLSPDTYPAMTFRSEMLARYILELPAGAVKAKQIQVDKTARFDDNRIRS